MDDRLRHHLCATYRLTPVEAERLHEEFLAWHHHTLADYARLRHGELKRRGWKNEQIFATIIDETADRRFAATPLTPRQLRRLIYG